MICPSCNAENKLTWKRYFLSPFGTHSCDACQNNFKMVQSFKYHSSIIALWLISGLPAFFVSSYFGASFIISFSLYWVVGLSVVIPMDRKFDDTWRGTKQK